MGGKGSDASGSRLLTGGTPFHQISGKYVIFGGTMGGRAPRGSREILFFCSTYKLKRPLAVLGYSTRPGRDVENGGRSHFVNIEFRGGRIAKNEAPGCPNSPPKRAFWVCKNTGFSE